MRRSWIRVKPRPKPPLYPLNHSIPSTARGAAAAADVSKRRASPCISDGHRRSPVEHSSSEEEATTG